MDFNEGDRIDVSAYWNRHGPSVYGPLATVIKVIRSPVLKNVILLCYQVDGYEYETWIDDDGSEQDDYHSFSSSQIVKYVKPLEYKYEPSQEGDKEDDI